MKKKKTLVNMNKKKKLGFFDILFIISDFIARIFKTGPIGFFFSDLYTKCNQKWKSGFLYNLFRKSRRKMRDRATFSSIYERSLINKQASQLSYTIIHSNLRIWGVAMLFFALSTIGVVILKQYLNNDVTIDNLISLDNEETFERLILGMVIVALSLPLIISKKELGESLLKWRLTRFVIVNILNLNPTTFERDSDSTEGNYLSAGLLATSIGMTTYQLKPLTIMLVAVAVIVFSLTMTFPEIGIIFLLIALPFANVLPSPFQTVVLLIILGFTACGFIFKLLRGRRVIRFELIDVLVMAFGGLLFFGGIFTFDGLNSLAATEIYFVFLLIYFLIVNMYIGKPAIHRAFKIVSVTATVLSIVGVIHGGVVNSSTVDLSKFKDMPGRVSVFLDNPNVLGTYLTIVFPLILGLMLISKRKISKVMYLISAIFVGVCTLMTGSRGAWLGMIASTAVFLIVYNFKNIWIVITSAVVFPLLGYILPSAFTDRFNTIFYGIVVALGNSNASEAIDTSIAYRFNIWENVSSILNDHFVSGIGMGERAFRFVYDGYIDLGESIVAHSHSLPLQILVSLGIVGLIVFALIIFTYGQICFVEIKSGERKSKSRTMVIAGLSSMCGALVIGLTDYIWYNYRVFVIFWMVMALTVSLARNNAREREATKTTNNMTNANMDIIY